MPIQVGRAPTSITTVGTEVQSESRPSRALEAIQFAEETMGDVREMARKLTALARGVVQVARTVFASPILRANLHRDVVFTSGGVVDVDHRLGRKWEGFIVCSKQVVALDAYATRQDDTLDAKHLRLTPNATGTADVLVW